MEVTSIYSSGEYLAHNPDWHAADAPWKALRVLEILDRYDVRPRTICDVGCGVGEVLRILSEALPEAHCEGFEVSPQAHAQSLSRQRDRLEFHLADLLQTDRHFDLRLVLDVIEHVEDPFSFLRQLRPRAAWHVIHVPLAVTVSAALRPGRLLEAWHGVGHIHLFTRETALATIEQAGLEVVGSMFTRGWADKPELPLRSRLMRVPRYLLSAVSDTLAARVLGGYSLMVLARGAA